jgi:hypothetical protein
VAYAPSQQSPIGKEETTEFEETPASGAEKFAVENLISVGL